MLDEVGSTVYVTYIGIQGANMNIVTDIVLVRDVLCNKDIFTCLPLLNYYLTRNGWRLEATPCIAMLNLQ